MLTLLEAPTPFVTVPMAKAHLSVSHTRDDTMIEAQINSAIAFLDGPQGYLGSAIAAQKWRYQFGAFSDPLRLPIGPVISIDALSYWDTTGAIVQMDLATVYLFGDAVSPYVRPIGHFPSDVRTRDDAVTIDLTVGRASVPDQLVSAALLIVGQLYRHREIDVDVRNFPTSFGMYDLAHPYRAVF
jgi:uncharacterized phiE125 gp8 family phage protein